MTVLDQAKDMINDKAGKRSEALARKVTEKTDSKKMERSEVEGQLLHKEKEDRKVLLGRLNSEAEALEISLDEYLAFLSYEELASMRRQINDIQGEVQILRADISSHKYENDMM